MVFLEWRQKMVDKSALKGYKLDVRDFSEEQLIYLNRACYAKKPNKEFQRELRSALRNQEYQKKAYFKRVSRAREDAYRRHQNKKLYAKLRIPESFTNWFRSRYEKTILLFQSLIPVSATALYGQDTMKWPEIVLDEKVIGAPYIMAAMPEECVKMTGWGRVKQAFLPKFYLDDYNKDNPSHTYNMNAFLYSTFAASVFIGIVQGIQHGKTALAEYKKSSGGELYESQYWAHRARHDIFFRSFVRYSFRWGWRSAFIFGVAYLISQSATIYRMEDRISHYVAGGGVAGALFKWKQGPLGMLTAFTAGSLLLGAPIGILLASLGFNPRPIMYYANVDAKLSSPLHGSKLPPEKLLLSSQRVLAILELIEMQPSQDTEENEFYKSFFGNQKQ